MVGGGGQLGTQECKYLLLHDVVGFLYADGRNQLNLLLNENFSSSSI